MIRPKARWRDILGPRLFIRPDLDARIIHYTVVLKKNSLQYRIYTVPKKLPK
jgi:hypothetical protein